MAKAKKGNPLNEKVLVNDGNCHKCFFQLHNATTDTNGCAQGLYYKPEQNPDLPDCDQFLDNTPRPANPNVKVVPLRWSMLNALYLSTDVPSCDVCASCGEILSPASIRHTLDLIARHVKGNPLVTLFCRGYIPEKQHCLVVPIDLTISELFWIAQYQ